MAELKRRTLTLVSGKQIKLYGSSMAIGASLEIGEGSAPNIFSFLEQQPEEKILPENTSIAKDGKAVKENPVNRTATLIMNPYRLTANDLMEIADYNIQLWMDLKNNIRKHGINSPKTFNSDAVR
ncbi:MAG: hypothetical protein ABIR15_14495 [Chitinophagaceae bacterium]